MNFLNADDVVVLGKSSEEDVLFLLESCGEPGDPISLLVFQVMHPETAIWTTDTCVPVQSVSLYSWWLKSISSPTEVWKSRVSVFQDVHHLILRSTAKD